MSTLTSPRSPPSQETAFDTNSSTDGLGLPTGVVAIYNIFWRDVVESSYDKEERIIIKRIEYAQTNPHPFPIDLGFKDYFNYDGMAAIFSCTPNVDLRAPCDVFKVIRKSRAMKSILPRDDDILISFVYDLVNDEGYLIMTVDMNDGEDSGLRANGNAELCYAKPRGSDELQPEAVLSRAEEGHSLSSAA